MLGKWFIAIAAAGILVFPSSVIGQKDNDSQQRPIDTINIDQVVVTATRTDARIKDVPVRIHAITATTLVTMPLHSVDDALKMVPGVNINRSFGVLSSKATITMRGLSGKEQGRVLVLMDGIPLNKSDGGTVDWNMIDVSGMERIEVTKGAGSAIYGGSAMGGIINIITAKPKKKFELKAGLEYGSFNTKAARISTGGRPVIPRRVRSNFSDLYWNVGTFFRQSDGYITQPEAERRENPFIVKSNMKEAGVTMRSGVKYHRNHQLDVILKYYNDRRGTGEKVFQPEGNTTDHDSWGAILNYESAFGKRRDNVQTDEVVAGHPAAKVLVKSSLYVLTEKYKKINEYFKDDYTWYNVLSTRSDFGWLNNASVVMGRHQVTAGLDWKIGGVDGVDEYFTSTDMVYNHGKLFTGALFLQDEIKVTGRVRLIVGLRYDNATFYNGAFYILNATAETQFMEGYEVPDMGTTNWAAWSPRISAQFRPNERTRFYAMISRGFRPSELEYLCRSGRIKGGFKMASPELKPEYLTNLEAGADITPFSKARLEVSAFHSLGKDFQYYVYNGHNIDMGFGDRPIFIRDNLSSVRITGAEAEFVWHPLSGLLLHATYSWAQSKIMDYVAVTPGDTINLNGKFFTDVPAQLATAGVSYVNKWLSGSVLIRYNGSMYINDRNNIDEVLGILKYPDYVTADVKIWKDIKHVRASIGVQNLTDVIYYDSKYNVNPGRMITAGISLQF